MKKLVITLLMLTPLLAGCAMVDTRVTINDDKSASVVTSLTYEGNIANIEDINAVNIAKNYEKFLDKDYKIETAFQNKLSTITASKNVRNLKRENLDLSSLGLRTNLESGNFIDIKQNMLITSFNIDCVYGEKAAKEKITISTPETIEKQIKPTLVPEYYQKYGDMNEMEPAQNDDFASNLDEDTKQFVKASVNDTDSKTTETKDKDFQATFSVKVPSFASYNNADFVNGNVYTWNLKNDEPTTIKLQYVKYSGFTIGIVLIFGVLLLVLLARKIRRHDSLKRIDNNDNIV